MQRIMVTCQQSEVGNVFGRDFTFFTEPIIADLQIFEKQPLNLGRFFGGCFQDFLDL